MGKKFKVLISFILCFLLIIGQFPTGIRVKASSDSETALEMNRQLSVSQSVYENENTQKRVVAGRVTLPFEKVAPVGGLAFTVKAVSGSDSSSSSVFIPEGSNNVEYSLEVKSLSGYTVSYSTFNTNYMSGGYYNSKGTVASISEATYLDLRTQSMTGINIEPISKRVISGTVTLPFGDAPPTGIEVIVAAKLGSNSDIQTKVKIPANESSVEYSILVPPNQKNTGYSVKYKISNEVYASEGYYSLTGTVRSLSSAKLVDLSNSDIENIDLSLIPNKKIGGVASLPDGVASSEGVDVTLTASNGIYSSKKTVKIAENSSLAEFTLYVPEGSGYTLKYETKNAEYTNLGYYSLAGTVRGQGAAYSIDVSGSDKMDIDFPLIPKKVISGKVVIPDGVASNNGLNVKLTAQCGSDSASVSVTIPEGSSMADYFIKVPPNYEGTGYNIKCETSDREYLSSIFYSSDGSVRSGTLASLMDVSSEDKDNIDINLIPKKTIRGKVTLPEGVAPEGGLGLKVNAIYGSDKDSINVNIPEGSSSTDYILYVPDGSGYKVSYELSNKAYINKGYYNVIGTVSEEKSATLVSTISGNKTGINMTIIAKSLVSGTIVLPSGRAPAGGINVEVIVSSGSSKLDSISVTIPQGEVSAQYSVYVPKGSGYNVSYKTSDSLYVSPAYYNNNYMVRTLSSATLIDVTDNNISGIKLTLIEKRSINGVISMPSGTAPKDGLKFVVTAYNNSDSMSQTVIIPEGKDEITYSINIPANEGYKIKCELKTLNAIYMNTIYYSSGGAVYNLDSASSVSTLGGNLYNINIMLLEKRTVSGTFSMPAGLVSPVGGLTLVHKIDGMTTYVTIPGGEKSAPFTFYYNPGVYTVGYECDEDMIFVSHGYYSKGGTVTASSKADKVDLTTGNQVGVNIVLLLKNSISGTVSLSNGVAPSGGYKVTVKTSGSTGSSSEIVTIPEGEKSADYKLFVTPGEKYSVWYEVSEENFVSPMYYNSSEMVIKSSMSTFLDLKTDNKVDIDLKIMEKRTLSGSVILPSGVAPKSEIAVKVSVSNGSDTTLQSVTIAEGQSFAKYSVFIPAGKDYKVQYTLSSDTNYASGGYYSIGGTTLNVNSATLLDLTTENKTEVNMTMIENKIISGTLSMPSGTKATSAISATIFAGNNYSTNVTIAANTNSSAFSIKVPPNVEGSGYKVYYKISNTQFLSPGYYNTMGMTVVENGGELIDVSTQDKKVNLVLIPKSSISGTVQIPQGFALKGGLSLTVTASNGKNSGSATVKILEGANSGNYTIYVPSGTDYQIKYDISNEAYIKNGYYSGSTTVRDSYMSKLVDLENENKTGIDLTLIAKNKIEGSIDISPRVAPSGGLSVDVKASNGIDNGNVSVKIPQGYSFVPYTIYVPSGKAYTVSYEVSDNSFMSPGYYGNTVTTLDKTAAKPIDVLSNISSINIPLISKKAIKGQISIPNNGVAPSGGVTVTMYALNKTVTLYSTSVTIPGGYKSAPYTLYVPSGEGYTVKYNTSNTSFIKEGYYSSAGTTEVSSSATSLNVINDVANINVAIIPKNIISGTVLIPEGFAPIGGISVQLTAKNNTTNVSLAVTIPEGQNSAPYTIYVPSDKDYSLMYSTSATKYVDLGYYSVTGTTRDSTKLTLIDTSRSSQYGINLKLIQKKTISGRISVPLGLAPFGGIKLTLEASNGKDKGNISMVIPEVSSFVNYEMYVPAGVDYILNYNITNFDGKYLYPGYYSVSGAKRDKDKASYLDLSNENATGINMNLIANRSVSGSIFLPEGVAPTGGLNVNVVAANARDSVKMPIVIAQGTSSGTYKMYLPEGNEYKIGYEITYNDYLSGFYNSNGTVLEKGEASLFNVGKEDISGLNIHMFPKRSISGKVSLPEGKLAPAGGILVTVGTGKYSVKVTIPEGKNAVDYNLKVAPNESESGYIVQYSIASSYDYVPTGYFGSSKTEAGKQTAVVVDVSSGNKSGINLEIMNKRIIRGTVKLQSGEAPVGGIGVKISADGTSYSTNVTIPYGTSLASYELKVLPNSYESGYRIKCSIDASYNYVNTAYYSETGIAQNVSEANLIDVYNSNKTIGELIIPNTNSIRGKVSIPDGKAPSGGLVLSITAENGKNSSSTNMTIPEGSTSKDYVLYITPGSGYKIYYNILNNEYVQKGYYNNLLGTVSSANKAEAININDGNVSGVNLSLIENRKISGSVSLPSGMEAPENGVEVIITADNTVNKNSINVIIPEGENSASYVLYMTPAADYKLSYVTTSTLDYVKSGYYSNSVTSVEQGSASLIDISTINRNDINIELVKNTVLSGDIVLPSGIAQKGGINVKVTASNSKYSNNINVSIPEGKSICSYLLPVTPAADYTVSYQVSSGLDYVPNGYYSILGTVSQKSSATAIDMSHDDNEGINITLINYNAISGTISLPEGNAPKGGIAVKLYAKNSSVTREVSVVIPESMSSLEYNIFVPDGKSYKVYYLLLPNAEYVDKGYYTPYLTVQDENSTVTLDVLGESIPDIDLDLISKNVISGTISLPNGEKAPKDGVEVKVTALDGEEKLVTIPYGSNFVSYSLKVLPNLGGYGYKVMYETVKDYGYIGFGYYSEGGCVRDIKNAKVIDVSTRDMDNINLILERPRTISGKVLLPEGTAPSEGVTLNVIASNKIDSTEVQVYIPEGETGVEYVLNVPPNDKGYEYKIKYENWINNSYVSAGYFNTDGTVKNANYATGVNVRSSNATGINIKVLGKEMVSGTVSIADGSAPAGGLVVTVSAKNDEDTTISYVTIPAGANSASYSINIPVGKDYSISYEISAKNNLVSCGYYNRTGTTYLPAKAELLDLRSEGKDNINITLLNKKSINGTISLPYGTAPKGGMKVEIYAENAGDTWITIPEGSNSAPYSLEVEPNVDGIGYKVNYRISAEYGLVNYGYYTPGGTVRSSKLASLVNANDRDVTGINMKMMQPRKVKGSISLPDGLTAPLGGINLNINVLNEIDGASTVVTIPYRQNSVEYTVSVPPNDVGVENQYRVRYENWSNPVYTTYGYYGKAGSTINFSYADPVDVHSKDIDGINMTLLRKHIIAGKLDIPQGYTVPPEGLDVTVFVSNGMETYSSKVTIPNGKNSVEYSVHVEAGSGYKVYYYDEYNNELVTIGYYSETGMTTDSKQAKVFTVENTNITGINLKLLLKRQISGYVTIPKALEMEDGLEVIISASNGLNLGITKVIIPKGETTVQYILSLPAGKEYKLQYDIIDHLKEFASSGYYSTSGTARNEVNSYKIDLSSDNKSDINIAILENLLISGFVQLPFGMSPEGGMEVTVTAVDNLESATEKVVIPEGESSVAYMLSVPPSISGYRVRYSMESNDYATLGYYSDSGTVFSSSKATHIEVSESNIENINLTLIRKKIISGIVSLPKGSVADGELTVKIRSASKQLSESDIATVTIKSGESLMPYELKVSPNTNGADYILSYEVTNGKGYISKGYYNTAETVPDETLASTIDVRNGDYTNANIELIKSKKISGRVFMPSDAKISGSGVVVTIFAQKTDYTGFKVSKDVLIPANQSYVDYLLYVPESTSSVAGLNLRAYTDNGSYDTIDDYSIYSDVFVPLMNESNNSGYKVGYVYTNSNDYCQNGFYSSKGTVLKEAMADKINLASQAADNIDINLLKNERKIKGTISLPVGKTASQPITLSIEVENDALQYSIQKSITINKGKSNAEYELLVPAVDDFTVKYYLDSKYGYVNSGFYGEDGVKGNIRKASSVNVKDVDVEGINLSLIQGKTISGKISLPSGLTVGRSDFWMWVKASNENYEASTYVPMSKGASSANYSVIVPEGSDYIVSYQLVPLFGEYVNTGYYNSSQTTPNADCATKLKVAGNTSNINLMLLPVGRAISGTISLPDGKAAVPYEINVPSNSTGSGYIIGFDVESENDDGEFLNQGYYSTGGTANMIENAAIVYVSGQNALQKDMTLLTEDTKGLEGIMFNKLSATIQCGISMNLGIKFIPEDATNKMVKWSSSNTNIAVVSSQGVVTAMSSGTVIITALSHNSLKTVCTITVVPSNPLGLSIDKTSLCINKGEGEQLTAIFNPQDQTQTVVWKSNNESVAVVEDGMVKAIASGDAIITAESEADSSIRAECYVSVAVPVSKIELSDSSLTIRMGDTPRLAASVFPDKATSKGVVWSSDNENIVKVSQTGDIKTVGDGTTNIIARSAYNPSIKAVCKVEVIPVPVEAIVLNQDTVELYPNEIFKLIATVLPAQAHDKRVKWESADTDIATVSPEGIINSKAMGEVTITVTSIYDNSIKAKCIVKVKPKPVTSVTISTKNVSVLIGASTKLVANVIPYNASDKTLIWSSSNDAVAEVSQDGTVTGKALGTAIIKAISQSNGRITDECTVKVEPVPVKKVVLSVSSKKVEVDGKVTLKVSVEPDNATNKNLNWSSSNTRIASVSNSGVITGKSEGTVTITVVSEDNKNAKAQCTVKVQISDETGNVIGSGNAGGGSGGASGGGGGSAVTTAIPTPSKTVSPTVTPTPTPTLAPTIIQDVTPVPGANNIADSLMQFIDIKGHWAERYFAVLIQDKIVSGYPDNTLRPNLQITRAEAAVMVVKAAKFEISKSQVLNLSDKQLVQVWAKPFIITAIDGGVIKGYEDGSFRPNNKITRCEMIVMVLKAFGIEQSFESAMTFSDSNTIPEWSKRFVKKGVDLEIIKGYNDNTFGPNKEITRAEAATIIAKCMELKKQ